MSKSVIIAGGIQMDVIMRLDHLSAAGEAARIVSMAHYPGGRGANQAVAAARMGAAVILSGAIGTDAFGAAIAATLEAEGVDLRGVARLSGYPTGISYVAIGADGERQALLMDGANRCGWAGCPVIPDMGPMIALTQLDRPLDVVRAFLESGGANTLRLLDASPFQAAALGLFMMCDIVIVNEAELALYAGADPVPAALDDVVAMARSLLVTDRQWIIVTRERLGAVAVSRNDLIEVGGAQAMIVDPNGAGDCFCGVLAAMLAEGHDLRIAMAAACRAAGIAVEQAGVMASFPWRGGIKIAA